MSTRSFPGHLAVSPAWRMSTCWLFVLCSWLTSEPLASCPVSRGRWDAHSPPEPVELVLVGEWWCRDAPLICSFFPEESELEEMPSPLRPSGRLRTAGGSSSVLWGRSVSGDAFPAGVRRVPADIVGLNACPSHCLHQKSCVLLKKKLSHFLVNFTRNYLCREREPPAR